MRGRSRRLTIDQRTGASPSAVRGDLARREAQRRKAREALRALIARKQPRKS